MITILGKLDEDVEVNVTLRPRQHGEEKQQFIKGTAITKSPFQATSILVECTAC